MARTASPNPKISYTTHIPARLYVAALDYVAEHMVTLDDLIVRGLLAQIESGDDAA